MHFARCAMSKRTTSQPARPLSEKPT